MLLDDYEDTKFCSNCGHYLYKTMEPSYKRGNTWNGKILKSTKESEGKKKDNTNHVLIILVIVIPLLLYLLRH